MFLSALFYFNGSKGTNGSKGKTLVPLMFLNVL